MISTQEEWRESVTGTLLDGAEVGFVIHKGLAHTRTHAHTHISKKEMTAQRELKSSKIRANRASSKVTGLFLMQ